MSDAPPRGPGSVPGITVPLAARPAHAPAPPFLLRHPATQMSPSAVPSTLESPKDPLILDLGAATQLEPRLDVTLPSSVDDAPNGSTLRDDTARDAAIHEAVSAADAAIAAAAISTTAPFGRRHGPATQMSPVPGASAPSSPPRPPLAAEDAVVDAVLPSAAFSPPPAGTTLDMSGGYGDGIQHAGWGAPGAHAGAFEARDPRAGGHGVPLQSLAPVARAPRANGTLIALIAGGVVVLVVGIGIIGAGTYFLSARARAGRSGVEPVVGGGGAQGASPAPVAAATEGPPPKVVPRVNDGPRLQGGTKAKVSELTASGVDVTGSRNAITAALPRLDACFVASETEAPGHETATYDLDLAPTGVVTRAEPAGAAQAAQGARASRLDACVVTVLRGVRLPRSAGGGRVKVTLSAPIKGGG